MRELGITKIIMTFTIHERCATLEEMRAERYQNVDVRADVATSLEGVSTIGKRREKWMKEMDESVHFAASTAPDNNIFYSQMASIYLCELQYSAETSLPSLHVNSFTIKSTFQQDPRLPLPRVSKSLYNPLPHQRRDEEYFPDHADIAVPLLEHAYAPFAFAQVSQPFPFAYA